MVAFINFNGLNGGRHFQHLLQRVRPRIASWAVVGTLCIMGVFLILSHDQVYAQDRATKPATPSTISLHFYSGDDARSAVGELAKAGISNTQIINSSARLIIVQQNTPREMRRAQGAAGKRRKSRDAERKLRRLKPIIIELFKRNKLKYVTIDRETNGRKWLEVALPREKLRELKGSFREFKENGGNDSVVTMELPEKTDGENIELFLEPAEIRAPYYRSVVSNGKRHREINDYERIGLFQALEGARSAAFALVSSESVLKDGSKNERFNLIGDFTGNDGKRVSIGRATRQDAVLSCGDEDNCEVITTSAASLQDATQTEGETCSVMDDIVSEGELAISLLTSGGRGDEPSYAANSPAATQSAAPIVQAVTSSTCRYKAEVATEVDNELVKELGGVSMANAQMLIAQMYSDSMFRMQLGVELVVTFQHAWSAEGEGDPDPYDNPSDLDVNLSIFADYFNRSFPSSDFHYDTAQAHLWGVDDPGPAGLAAFASLCRGTAFSVFDRGMHTIWGPTHEMAHVFGGSHELELGYFCNREDPVETYVMCETSSDTYNAEFSDRSEENIETQLAGFSCLEPSVNSCAGPESLSVVTGLKATEGESTELIDVLWDTASESISGYELLRAKASPSAAYERKYLMKLTSFEDEVEDENGPIPGVDYYYKVQLHYNGVVGEPTQPVLGWVKLKPPLNVVASDGEILGSVEITWSEVAGATNYQVVRSSTANPLDPNAEIVCNWVTNRGCSDISGTAGKRYYYFVRAAVNGNGDRPSDWSTPNTGWSKVIVPTPTKVQASDGTYESGVQVIWPPVPGPGGGGGSRPKYQVSREPYYPDARTEPQPISGWQEETVFYDTTAQPSGDLWYKYYYSVRAIYYDNEENPSALSEHDIGWRRSDGPAPVLSASDGVVGIVNLSWSAGAGVDGPQYRVFRSESEYHESPILIVPWQPGLSAQDPSAIPGKDYYYWVEHGSINKIDHQFHMTHGSANDIGWRGFAKPVISASDGTSTSSVQISWSSAGATGYDYRAVLRNSIPDIGTAQVLPSTPDDNTEPGVPYYYWVVIGMSSVEDEAPPYQLPQIDGTSKNLSVPSDFDTGYKALMPPGNVQASDYTSPSTVSISWNSVSGATHYRVYRNTVSNPDTAVSLGAWQTTRLYTDNPPSQGTLYYYYVRAAVDSSGSRPSALSAPDKGITGSPVPTNVQASDGTSTSYIGISWSAVVGTGYYQIYRNTVNDPATATVVRAWSTATSFADYGVSPGVTYYFWVKSAINSSGANASGFSASDLGWRALSAPTSVTASNSAGPVNVAWAAVTGATYYQVYRNIINDSASASVVFPWQTSRSFTDNAGIVGTTYYYWVKAAIDDTGSHTSAFSASVSSSIKLSKPQRPQASSHIYDYMVFISWNTVPNATHYKLFRDVDGDPSGRTALTSWVTGLSFKDVTAVPGKMYYYWVQAATSSTGSNISALSDNAMGARKLSPPTALSAIPDGAVAPSITVKATESCGASFHALFRSRTSDAATAVQIGNWLYAVPSTSCPSTRLVTMTDSTAQAGVKYYYYWMKGAISLDGGAASAFSTPDTGWRRDPLPPPSAIYASDGDSADSVGVIWALVSGASYYQVYRSPDSNPLNATALTPTWQTQYWFFDTTAAPGVVYYYFVKAAMDSSGFAASALSIGDSGFR